MPSSATWAPRGLQYSRRSVEHFPCVQRSGFARDTPRGASLCDKRPALMVGSAACPTLGVGSRGTGRARLAEARALGLLWLFACVGLWWTEQPALPSVPISRHLSPPSLQMPEMRDSVISRHDTAASQTSSGCVIVLPGYVCSCSPWPSKRAASHLMPGRAALPGAENCTRDGIEDRVFRRPCWQGTPCLLLFSLTSFGGTWDRDNA